MPQLLTTNAQIKCLHGGTGTVPAPSAPLMTVSNGVVLVEGDTGVIAGCTLGIAPCVSFTLRSMHYNATRISSRHAVLVTDFQLTTTFLPLLCTETHPAMDNSTPTAIAPGQDAPPLPPELLDVTPPIVVVAPPVAAFNHATQTPPTVAFVFTISSAFPRQWSLTHVSTGGALDVTSGDIPGPTVVPAGGSWNSPTQIVTISLNTAYLNSLVTGQHLFYLTAVSKRGIPVAIPATLTVA
ncbi:MAG: hypothetical protein ABJB74_03005 [Gemmatimonas sp.]